MRKTCDPSTLGCSEVWHNRTSTVALLLGDKRNASAALYGLPLKGYDVKHVICVGNQDTVRALQNLPKEFTKPKQASRPSFSSASSDSTAPSEMSTEDDREDLEVSSSDVPTEDDREDLEVSSSDGPTENDKDDLAVEIDLVEEDVTYTRLDRSACQFTPCPMIDKMDARAVVDLEQDCVEQLTAVCTAVKELENCKQDSKRAVLLHCDQGRNRSPTLAMAFLMLDGASLRSAYGKVLAVRDIVDPIRPYREALKRMEMSLRFKCSVQPDDLFALHISDVQARFEEKGADYEMSAEVFSHAIRKRIESIAELKTTCSPTSNHSEFNHRHLFEQEHGFGLD